MRGMVAGLVLFAVMALGGPARAGIITEVDRALLLLVDVSGSISDPECELQRDAYASAFEDVLPLILDNPTGTFDSIAASVVYWSGGDIEGSAILPRVVVDWTVIDDLGTGQNFIDAIASSTRELDIEGGGQVTGGQTGVRDALDFARNHFGTLPVTADGLVLDVSGDGFENVLDGETILDFVIPGVGTLSFNTPSDWDAVAQARDALLGDGVDINGIAILSDELDSTPWADFYIAGLAGQINSEQEQAIRDFFGDETQLETFYRDYVIGAAAGQPVPGVDGEGSLTTPFLLTADGFEAFEAALRSKLIGDLTGTAPPVPEPAGAALLLLALGGLVARRARA